MLRLANNMLSGEAVCVTVGMIPIDILAREEQRPSDQAYLTGALLPRRQFA